MYSTVLSYRNHNNTKEGLATEETSIGEIPADLYCGKTIIFIFYYFFKIFKRQKDKRTKGQKNKKDKKDKKETNNKT